MAYIVTEACIKCKYTDCVEVCPVDCFHEGALMLVINPETCIDCGVCVPECPIDAIIEESPEVIEWTKLNHALSQEWPSITKKKAMLPEADSYKNEQNKLEKYMPEFKHLTE